MRVSRSGGVSRRPEIVPHRPGADHDADQDPARNFGVDRNPKMVENQRLAGFGPPACMMRVIMGQVEGPW